MSLRVIDAASHQGNMNLAAMDFDALIVKATEGTTYVNPYCDGEFQEALRLGKKLGVYHFARNASGNSAEAEANFFIENTKGYIGKAIPVLDWEDSDTSDVAWALRWLQTVEKAYGCKPMLYTSESVVNAYNWSSVAAADYGLWCAKYADYIPDYAFDMAGAGPAPKIRWWSTMALWQWTSVGRLNGHNGNLDCSVFYGDRDTWDKYVGKRVTEWQNPGNAVNDMGLYYQGHSQTAGWLEKVRDGQTAGTTGRGKRLEAIKIDAGRIPGLVLNVKAHIQGIGWKLYKNITKDTVIGTTGEEKRLEAIEIEAVGLPAGKKLLYRVHVQKEGWTGWVESGFTTGSTGIRKRIEAIQIKIVDA